MLDPTRLKAFRFPVVEQSYTDRDALLYALALGVAGDPVDPTGLRFAHEESGAVLPTFAAVLGAPGMWTREYPELGIGYAQMVHGEQRMRFHRPLPLAATVRGESRIGRVVDKGAGKGALVEVLRDVRDAADGALLASMAYLLFCRADGGFSAGGAAGDAPGEALPAVPGRPPEQVQDWPTRPDAALLYRLTGDRNDLHALPAVAARGGFPRPILHGLATYGMAGAALLRQHGGNRPERLAALACRFSAPVYPGEALRTESWRDGERVAFQVVVPARGVVAISHGHAEFRPAGPGEAA